MNPPPHIEARGLEMAYGETAILRDISFTVRRGEVFVIMGGSGCGKSTLLKHLTGLLEPVRGEILYEGRDFSRAEEEDRQKIMRRFGVLYQGGALWSSMTVAENAILPLEEYTSLPPRERAEAAALKLALVGLEGYGGYYPSQLSGGMRKRAALARAIALDPDILFFDEPTAGLDPVTSKHMDDLILQLSGGLGATVVAVTHELPSIFAIADRALFLDAATRAATACGPPRELLLRPPNPAVARFLNRGAE